jgi:hypothetical protein
MATTKQKDACDLLDADHRAVKKLFKEYEDLTDFIVKVVSTEDYSMCAEGQKNMKAMPPGETLILGRNEGSIQSIHAHIEDVIANDQARA